MAGAYSWVSIAGMGALNSVSGTTATLPAGGVLGVERMEDGVKYRLFCNAGNNQISKGLCFARALGSALNCGAYSVTVTTTTEVADTVCGAVIHSTVPTANYFWGAVRGGPVAVMVSNISIATGAYIAVGGLGVHTKLTATTAMVGINLGDTTTATGTTDAISGRFFVYYE